MTDQIVIDAALQVREKLVAEIETMESDLRQKVIDLRGLDATLRLLSPGIELYKVIPQPFPPQHHAARGEVKTIILEALRDSTEPLTSTYLTAVIMKKRGMEMSDLNLQRTIRKRVVGTMTYLREARIVEAVAKQGQRNFWQLRPSSYLAKSHASPT